MRVHLLVVVMLCGCDGEERVDALDQHDQTLAACGAVASCAEGHCDDVSVDGVDFVPAAGVRPLQSPDVVRPAPPLIRHSVRLASDTPGEYLRPVIPAHRTSADARVALV